MWSELNCEQMEREENAWGGLRSAQEVEQMVVMVRLERYNRGEPHGPRALRQRLHQHYALKPLPSERTISRILARHGLSAGRTGWYGGEESKKKGSPSLEPWS